MYSGGTIRQAKKKDPGGVCSSPEAGSNGLMSLLLASKAGF